MRLLLRWLTRIVYKYRMCILKFISADSSPIQKTNCRASRWALDVGSSSLVAYGFRYAGSLVPRLTAGKSLPSLFLLVSLCLRVAASAQHTQLLTCQKSILPTHLSFQYIAYLVLYL